MTMTPASVRATTFAAAPRLRRGYDADQVDAFVERIAERLESGEGLSSNDVYHVALGRSGVGGRGYAAADVDRFLELVHAELSRLEDAWGHESAAVVDGDAGSGVAEPADAVDGASAGDAASGDVTSVETDGSPDVDDAPEPADDAPGDAARPGGPS